MSDLLIRGAEAVLTGLAGPAAREDAEDIRIRGGRIVELARGLQPEEGERVLDASGCVVYPGWVNTHHHLFQSLLKGVPAGIDQPLFGWLGTVPYPRLKRYSRELLELAATIGLAELLLSGTTTCADHHYLYFEEGDDELGDVLFDVVDRLGIRFVLCRGGATEVDRHPQYPTQVRPQSVERFAWDVERLVGRYHQEAPDAMRRVVMAPSTPTFSVSPAALRELAAHARGWGIRLHSHLSETHNYVDYTTTTHGVSPVVFCAEHDWVGPDVWFAHLVHVDDTEIGILAETGTGMAHCPASNCRLGSGIAPAVEMDRAGVPVSLAVDGAASNESADMISEAHLAWLIHRAVGGAGAVSAEDVVRWGTAGGASVLGLDAVGTLAPGMAADLVAYELTDPRYAGLHDPAIGPVVAGGAARVRFSLVQGRPVVEDGAIPGLDLPALQQAGARAVRTLA
ncbi:MAG: amidohydrolase family protein [Gammaproteobacteria bacterium]